MPDRRQGVRPLIFHRHDKSDRAVEPSFLRHTRAVLDQRLQVRIAQGVFANLRGRAFETQRRAGNDSALTLSGERSVEQVALPIS